VADERKWDHMPRWPKPNIKSLGHARGEGQRTKWAVIFTNPAYPHTRYTTGHHAESIAEAWAHLPTMCAWHSCPLPEHASPDSGDFKKASHNTAKVRT
jgi:hypothetical protein